MVVVPSSSSARWATSAPRRIVASKRLQLGLFIAAFLLNGLFVALRIHEGLLAAAALRQRRPFYLRAAALVADSLLYGIAAALLFLSHGAVPGRRDAPFLSRGRSSDGGRRARRRRRVAAAVLGGQGARSDDVRHSTPTAGAAGGGGPTRDLKI